MHAGGFQVPGKCNATHASIGKPDAGGQSVNLPIVGLGATRMPSLTNPVLQDGVVDIALNHDG